MFVTSVLFLKLSVLTFIFEFVSEDMHTTVTSAREGMFYPECVCMSVCQYLKWKLQIVSS